MAVFGKKPASVRVAKAPAQVVLGSGVRLTPVVSEKSERMRRHNQYAFSVRGSLSKVDVKKAVESTYGVRVVGVNSVALPRKTVRRGRSSGTTSVRRRFIVSLREGEIIDVTKAV